MRRVIALAALATLFLVPGSARAGGFGYYCPPDLPEPSEGTILVSDNCFSPQKATVKTGDTLTWELRAAPSPHTVTFESGLDSMDLAGPYTVRFNAPGVYIYYCRYHGAPGLGMNGKVVVGGGPNIDSPPLEVITSGATQASPVAAVQEPPSDPRELTVRLEPGALFSVVLILLGFAIGIGSARAVTRLRRP